MHDFPSYKDNLVSYDQDFDPRVFQSQESVKTTDSLFHEIMTLAEEGPTSRAVQRNLVISKPPCNGNATIFNGELGLSNKFMNEDVPLGPILLELPGFAHLQINHSESSCSESDDSSALPEERDAWTGYLDRPMQDDDSSNFGPLPGLEELDHEDWAGLGNDESSTEVLANLAGCGIVNTFQEFQTKPAENPVVIPEFPKQGPTSTTKKSNTVIKGGKSFTKKKKFRPNHDPAPNERCYVTLNEDLDVAMGRGGRTNKLPGNKLYHAEKLLLQDAYHAASKENRTIIAQQLVDNVHARGGRFLKQDGVGWYIVSNHSARTKASQALRERYTKKDRETKRQKYRTMKKAKEQQDAMSVLSRQC
eukprot:scaffold15669_cov160-Amphora_coffeaeformis.AAC.9